MRIVTGVVAPSSDICSRPSSASSNPSSVLEDLADREPDLLAPVIDAVPDCGRCVPREVGRQRG